MKIAIIGYGKMGKMIEHIALERGHEITVKIDRDNLSDFDSEAFANSDVAIEFTSPSTAFDNCKRSLEKGVRTVSGSTGWSDRLGEIKAICESHPATAFLWSSNYSLGVNVFFAVNRYLAQIMNNFSGYTPRMKEIHHIHKLDHPSGTAISLAEQIISECNRTTAWSEDPTKGPDTIVIDHEREGEVPGTHIIQWDSAVDTITIEHSAKSREGFALGAVMAAEWIAGETGFKTMNDFMDTLLAPAK